MGGFRCTAANGKRPIAAGVSAIVVIRIMRLCTCGWEAGAESKEDEGRKKHHVNNRDHVESQWVAADPPNECIRCGQNPDNPVGDERLRAPPKPRKFA